jgi:threonine synthase
MGKPVSTLVCSGCDFVVPGTSPYPFHCPKKRENDDIDHVLKETPWLSKDLAESFQSNEPNPFLKYRKLFHAYQTAIAWGLTDADYVGIVRNLDDAVRDLDGRGFIETPFEPTPELGQACGLNGTLWVKDETGNVSGSHKARHAMGTMIWLEVVRKRFPDSDEKPLAIASCGNAALAAAVVAKAAGRKLHVFVPPDAHPNVVKRLQELGARPVYCKREGNRPGDPCYLRFKEAVASGSLPFTVQGNENGLAISGGKTLAYEMVARWRRESASVDHLFVQVGGGALASSLIQGLADARALGLIDRLPRIHTVQTEGAFPLTRAFKVIVDRIRTRYPTEDTATVPSQIIDEELWFAANHRSKFMWPWESEPKSIAHGILDDETYDWLAVVEGMLRTGGVPIQASEEGLMETNRLAKAHTAIRADPTGTAGLAGAIIFPTEGSAAVLFTGIER